MEWKARTDGMGAPRAHVVRGEDRVGIVEEADVRFFCQKIYFCL